MRNREAFIFAVMFCALIFFAACAPFSNYRLSEYSQSVYKDIPLYPGSIAWSEDSLHLAVIQRGELKIIDVGSEKLREIPGLRPSFLDWSPGSDLLMVKDVNHDAVVKINAATGEETTISLLGRPVAVRWFQEPDSFIAISAEINRLKIGTFVKYYLELIVNSESEIFYTADLYYPTVREDIDFLSGWMFPGIQPVYETVLTPQFHKPPVVAPYMRFITVDPVLLEERKILKLDTPRFTVSSSWSPDGSQMALPNDEGLLIILNLENPEYRQPVNVEIRGRYPSWNPKRDLIYHGGWLLKSDGATIHQLLDDASDSIGVWSPDGKKIAVIANEVMVTFDFSSSLFLLNGTARDSDLINLRKKLRILKDLFKNRLITKKEFRDRRDKLFKTRQEM